MVRVIHLSPVHSDFQTQRSLEYLRRDLGADGSALTLGPGGGDRSAPIAAARRRGRPRVGAICACRGGLGRLPADHLQSAARFSIASRSVVWRRGGWPLSPRRLPQRSDAAGTG